MRNPSLQGDALADASVNVLLFDNHQGGLRDPGCDAPAAYGCCDSEVCGSLVFPKWTVLR